MGVTLSTSPAVTFATNVSDQGISFARLAGGGFVAATDKPGDGVGYLQVFNDAGAAVGARITVAAYAGGTGSGYGVLELAGLTGGGFVAVTTDGSVHPGQTDVVARVYSAAGALLQTLVVDSAPTGANEFAPYVVATADGGFQVVWSDDSSRRDTTFTTTRPNPPDTQNATEGRDVYAHAYAPVNGQQVSKTPGEVQINAPGFFTDAADQQVENWTQSAARLTNGNVVVGYHDSPVYNGANGYFNQWAFSDGLSFNVLGADGQSVVGRTTVRNTQLAPPHNSFNYVGNVSVSAAGDGFAFVYDERDIPDNQPYYQGVHIQFFSADGKAASSDALISPAGTNAFYGKAAPLPNGAGVAVLYETEHANGDLVARNLYIETVDTSGHVLSGPTLVTSTLQRPGGSYYPQADYEITARADGTLQVVWEDVATGHTNLESEVFTAVQTVNLPAATATAVSNVLRIDPNAASSQAFDATLVNLSPTAAVAAVVSAATSTSEVATLDYQFFTGKTPSAAGMDYLVSPNGPNPNNLNSAYYARFSTTNRYINFASNLGKVGEGAGAFQANYGSLSLTDATTEAYAAIFGTTPTADKVSHLLHDLVPNGVGGTYEREDYFASYGGDGLNGQGTKAAMVGWLLSQAAQADLGTYAKSDDAFLTDVANGQASFGVDLIGAYAKPAYAYTGG